MANTCEHGDHPAPDGQRFCSEVCQRCESSGEDDCTAACNAQELDRCYRRIEEMDGRRREGRELLRRMVKAVGAERSVSQRLARLTEQALDYLSRTHEQKDILR